MHKNSTVTLIIQTRILDSSVFSLNGLRNNTTDRFFSIVEQNYCLANEQPYKSSDILTSLSQAAAADGRVNETGQQTDKKNNDRSKTERGGGRDGPVDATEPTSSFGQQLQFGQQRRTGDKRRGDKGDSGRGRDRKKPRFLSN